MKSSNLAWRVEPRDESPESARAAPSGPEPREERSQRARPRPRFDRRAIEIRDQGFAPFRVR